MKRKLLSLFLAAVMMLGTVLMSIPVSAAEINYSDVNKDMWSYGDIVYVTENGLMNGTGGSTFSPAMSLTRGMVVTVLYRMEGSPRIYYKDLFVDVNSRAYYADAVVWAKDNGIVKATGTSEWGEEYFSPDRDITRQELATMFIRFAEYKNVITKTDATLGKFTDKSSVADWAESAMKWTTSVGLINGTGNGDTLSPTGKATREQFAAIMHRYADFASEFDYNLVYAEPKAISSYTEKPYPLVNDADIYVAVDGNDKNPGTLDKPLATFDAARLKVRELKKAAKDEIVVAFKAGNYGELNNVTFTAEDAGTEAVPIKYCKYGDGDVIFRNGIFIDESEFTVVDGEEAKMFKSEIRHNVYKVDLKGRVDRFDPYSTFLFSENGLTTEAREPNGRYFMNMTTTVNDHESIRLQSALPGLLESYKTLDGLKINGYLRTGWIQDNFLVKSYDPDTDIIVFDFENSKGDYLMKYSLDWFPLMFEGRTDDLVYFSNLPEFVDANGEYCFVNETSILYVYRAKGDYWVNDGASFATIEKEAEHISFVGLDFDSTSSDGIVVYADHFTFDLGKIYNIGGKAAIHCPNYVRNLTVKNSEIFNCVDSCVLVNSNEPIDSWAQIPEHVSAKIPGNNVIENNYFHDFTLPTYFSSGVSVDADVGTVIAHNYFKEGGHGGVCYNKSVGVRVEYNVFDAIVTKSEDFGAVYTCQSINYTDNITRYNIFKNIGYLGIYLDSHSSYQEIYGNVFHGAEIAQNAGSENKIDGNIFICSSGGGNIGSTGRGDQGPATTYMSHNVSVGGEFDFEKLGTVGENNMELKRDENPIFVNPSIGDYRFLEGKGLYDIPYEKIGRY